MVEFDYRRPASLAEVCEILAKTPGSAPIAGGTDLMVQLRGNEARWGKLNCVVDLSAISELREIRHENNDLFVGAMVTHAKVEKNSLIRTYAPVLALACSTVGSPQIRNRGTLGGAICNASPASDPVPALLCLGADVLLQGAEGQRRLAVDEFITGSGRTALRQGEIVVGFSIPLAEDWRYTFEKLGRRKALAISRMNVAAMARQDTDGRVNELRLVPGCVFFAPCRVNEVEVMLLGQVPTHALVEQTAAQMAAEMIRKTGVRWSTEYKQPVLQALTRRVLEQVLEVRDNG